MANDNETAEQVALSDLPLAEQLRIIRGNYSIGSGEFDALDEAADVVECHQREIAELKKRVEIAKNAFFKICQCEHSHEIHDIFCEAEFMMNHPEMREVQNEQEQH